MSFVSLDSDFRFNNSSTDALEKVLIFRYTEGTEDRSREKEEKTFSDALCIHPKLIPKINARLTERIISVSVKNFI